LNQLASAFPAACCGVSERNKIRYFPYWEDSLQLAAGSFKQSRAMHPKQGTLRKFGVAEQHAGFQKRPCTGQFTVVSMIDTKRDAIYV
jgi:hypothetical protein